MTAQPKAWMGLSEKAAGTVRVCSYCPDKVPAETLAALRGLAVTHGICPDCAAAQMGEMPAGEFLTVAEVNLICGARGWAAPAVFALLHWRQGEHYTGYGAELRIRRTALADLYGYFATSGAPEAAKRLWQWMGRATPTSYPPAAEESPAVQCSATPAGSDLAAERTSAAPAPRAKVLPWWQREALE